MEYMKKFDKMGNTYLGATKGNVMKIVILLFALGVVLYRMNLLWKIEEDESVMTMLFSSSLLLFIVMMLAFYSIYGSLTYSIIFGIVFTVIFNMCSDSVQEKFSLAKMDTSVYQGCIAIKASDLIDHFNGDVSKLNEAMLHSNVPLNLHINDENAPKIATYLINNKYNISETCKFPC